MAQPSKNQLLIASLNCFALALVLLLTLWNLPMNDSPVSKACPTCPDPSALLLIAEFGICRARKDGHNLYCKSCIRKKVRDSRRALKEYRAVRRGWTITREQTDSSLLPPKVELSPADRVKEAIRRGARTQRQIAQATRMGKDEIGNALADLILWTREIKSSIVNNIRQYFINDSPEFPDYAEAAVATRQADVRASFSTIEGLMPGKRRKAS